MNNGELVKGSQNISSWTKPGGKLGMFVAILLGGGVLMGLYKILPYLITLATNMITLAMLCGVLALILFIVTDKKIRMMFSVGYFMVMRAITGAIVELDPIAIVERRLLDMKKKIGEISKAMGDLNGLIRESESDILNKKKSLKTELLRVQEFHTLGKRGDAQVSENQAVRLEDIIKRKQQRLVDSKSWYEVLSKLEEMAKLTVADTENEITIRKEEFESIKKQHKAFKSVMSVMSGDPDEMALFTQAMDYMSNDINAKLGEMEHVLNSTGGLLSQYSVDNGVASKQANELLERYNTLGINGMFESFSTQEAEKIPTTINIDRYQNLSVSQELQTKSKYF